MTDHFGALDTEVLKYQLYLKIVRYINNERLGFKMKKWGCEIWNICTKEETCRVLENTLTNFGPI